eukprot:468348-Alexandrium_andersonii.AAC.1
MLSSRPVRRGAVPCTPQNGHRQLHNAAGCWQLQAVSNSQWLQAPSVTEKQARNCLNVHAHAIRSFVDRIVLPTALMCISRLARR